jgi:hypothetical protein
MWSPEVKFCAGCLNAPAPPHSAASFLRPDSRRDITQAEKLLAFAAENQTLKDAFVVFQKLTPQIRGQNP